MRRRWDRTRVIAVLSTLKDAGTGAPEIARLANVSRATAYRWIGGQVAPDYIPVRTLAWAIWREHPDEARELVEASGWPWQEPSETEVPPWTPLDEFFGSAEDAEEVREKIRRHKGAEADYWISAIETALSQPPAGAGDCPGPGGARARREG